MWPGASIKRKGLAPEHMMPYDQAHGKKGISMNFNHPMILTVDREYRSGFHLVSMFRVHRSGLGWIVGLLTTELGKNLKQLYFTQCLAKWGAKRVKTGVFDSPRSIGDISFVGWAF